MDTRLLKGGKTKEEREKIKETIKNSGYIIDLLTSILKEDLKEKEMSSKEDYDIPNWACYQADRNGYKRALKGFINLLNIKED